MVLTNLLQYLHTKCKHFSLLIFYAAKLSFLFLGTFMFSKLFKKLYKCQIPPIYS